MTVSPVVPDQPIPLVSPANLAFVEGLYDAYLRDPQSVDDGWRRIFAALPSPAPSPGPPPPFPAPAAYARSVFAPPAAGRPDGARSDARGAGLEERARRLIEAYREHGHLSADLDPLGLSERHPLKVSLAAFGLTEAHLDTLVRVEGVAGSARSALRELVALLSETYTQNIGVELAHIHDLELRYWLQDRMESTRNRASLSVDEQRRLLEELTGAEVFEQFLHAKFLGAKRFSLEGAESLIPLLDRVIDRAARSGVDEIVMGMAHRGRLNVLANIMGKPAAEIFAEFLDPTGGSDTDNGGDVKYHLGYSYDRARPGGRVHLSLAFNPSHLEWVNAVVQGRVRAKQDRQGDAARTRCLPLLIHGESAFAGQGIVAEGLNMSELPGFTVGGTVHVVVNNQVGFTTSRRDAYSTTYPTDVARMLQIPIFHVNGEATEAVAQVADLAVDFRQRFHRDVIIDLWCYRKHGHNEGDEPSFTQPVMYRAIAAKSSIREIYADKLCDGLGVMTRAEADAAVATTRQALEQQLAQAADLESAPRPSSLMGAWSGYLGGRDADAPDVRTGVSPDAVARVGRALHVVPDGFSPHPKIQKILEARAAMAAGSKPLDWAMAEALAFGTLLDEGTPIRLSGQDTRRGTFSQRHAVLFDYETGREHAPLAELGGTFDVRDSPLSEAAVLGFEYGYSLDTPGGLCLWEAQFGDFVNAAQVIVDQFICSSESKWNRVSGLVLLLPHGMEGQGPEHSSARLERFLNMAVLDNIQVCNLTTPAQYFHALRRQVLRRFRKPLIIATPKSLLRLPAATSTIDDLTRGTFRNIVFDREMEAGAVRRVLLCTGKIYYDLRAARASQGVDDVAIIRIEQIYPLRKDEILEALSDYEDGTPVVWVQEEPRNMGAWNYVNRELPPLLGPISCVSRPVSASPATGSPARHKAEQAKLMDDALGGERRGTKAKARTKTKAK